MCTLYIDIASITVSHYFCKSSFTNVLHVMMCYAFHSVMLGPVSCTLPVVTFVPALSGALHVSRLKLKNILFLHLGSCISLLQSSSTYFCTRRLSESSVFQHAIFICLSTICSTSREYGVLLHTLWYQAQ